jgi:hypothetical protein
MPMIEEGSTDKRTRLARIGGVYPIGDSVGIVNVGGSHWELLVCWNGAMRVYSFVAPSQRTSFNQDIKPFFNHVSANQGFPASSQHLISKKPPVLEVIMMMLTQVYSSPVRHRAFHWQQRQVQRLLLVGLGCVRDVWGQMYTLYMRQTRYINDLNLSESTRLHGKYVRVLVKE